MEQVTHAPDFSGLDPETGERWSPAKVAKLLGLRTVKDEAELRGICERILEANPSQVSVFRKGKTGILGFFVKKVMDETKNGADPTITDRILREILGS